MQLLSLLPLSLQLSAKLPHFIFQYTYFLFFLIYANFRSHFSLKTQTLKKFKIEVGVYDHKWNHISMVSRWEYKITRSFILKLIDNEMNNSKFLSNFSTWDNVRSSMETTKMRFIVSKTCQPKEWALSYENTKGIVHNVGYLSLTNLVVWSKMEVIKTWYNSETTLINIPR